MYIPQKNISIALSAVSEYLSGRLQGNPDQLSEGLCSLDDLKYGHIAFLSSRHVSKAVESFDCAQLSALIVPENAIIPPQSEMNFIFVPQPLIAMTKLVNLFFKLESPSSFIHPTAQIDPSALIGANASVGAFCVIGQDVHIGDNAVLHPHVVLYRGARLGRGTVVHSGACIREYCTIDENVCIQNGAVIGADGFGYSPSESGLLPIPQIGIVHIQNSVDIGANACVDRATFGETRIGAGTKIDNLVQIGHNVHIGSHTILCGQVGIAGSTSIGNRVVIGGMSGVVDHRKIVDGVRVAAKSAVLQDILQPGDYSGQPAIPARQWARKILSQNASSERSSD